MVKLWKRLPREVADAPSPSMFKRYLDIPLVTGFNFGSVLKCQAAGLDDQHRPLPNEIAYSKHTLIFPP